jgi:hypothetical protein
MSDKGMTSATLLVQSLRTSAIRDPGLLVLLGIFLLLVPLSTPRIYATDEVQYYAYLRSAYVDGDLDFRNEYTHFAAIGQQNDDPAIYNALLREHPDDPPVNPQTGLLRNVAPVGSALLWAPGFILTDGTLRLLNLLGADLPTDGYARPYIWAVCFMSALYSLCGVLLTYRLARRFVACFPATLATATVWLATPLVFYSHIAMPLSHSGGFFLFALFLTVWLAGWQGPLAARNAQRSLATWAALGLLGGLMTITREQLGLLLLIPAVEGLLAYARLARSGDWGAAGRLLAGHVVFMLCLLLALTPQLAAYQILNGQLSPSSTVSGKLDWFSPNALNTLLHPHHGALLWSPVLVFGLLGLGWLARHDGLLAALLALGFLAQTYINGAFGTTWHLSGAFGFRRLIECTPIFVLGLAALLAWVQPRSGRVPLLLAGLLLVYWNAGLIAQWAVVRPALRSGLIWEGMLYYQFVETPRQVIANASDLLFNRCRLVENQNC